VAIRLVETRGGDADVVVRSPLGAYLTPTAHTGAPVARRSTAMSLRL